MLFRTMSLRGKLLVYFLLFALVPFFLAVYFGLSRFEATLITREVENARNLTILAGDALSRALDRALSEAIVLAQTLRGGLFKDQIEKALRDAVERDPVLASASLVNGQGVQIADSGGLGIGEDKSQTD